MTVTQDVLSRIRVKLIICRFSGLFDRKGRGQAPAPSYGPEYLT